MAVSDIGADDLIERLFYSLKNETNSSQKTKTSWKSSEQFQPVLLSTHTREQVALDYVKQSNAIEWVCVIKLRAVEKFSSATRLS
jgi:hypothetical protein